MRLTVIAVGRLKSGPERELVQRYEKRLAGLGKNIGLAPLRVIELTESRAAQTAARTDQEAREILAKCGPRAALVLLDEAGQTATSDEFAKLLAGYRDTSASEICFLIGGPDGHGEAARAAAHATFSLSKLTLPHGLARVVLIEQLYRAATILSGHPYHRA
jgi:23S rRNA (pseudouridine1915-N3)-methyltransferase